MDTMEILSLPGILFSHSFRADAYNNCFSPRKDFLEISYIAEGALYYRTQTGIWTAKQGDIICLCRNDTAVVRADLPHCHNTVGIFAQWRFSSDPSRGLLLPPLTSAERGTASVCRMIDDFVRNHTVYKASPEESAAKILALLCAVDKCNRTASVSKLPGEVLYTKQAKDYILQNIRTPITQKSVADHLGVSPEYLCAVFKRTEGTTVMRYINKLKLENIKALIDHTNLRLYEASSAYGYRDPNYVSRLYKQLFGKNITDVGD